MICLWRPLKNAEISMGKGKGIDRYIQLLIEENFLCILCDKVEKCILVKTWGKAHFLSPRHTLESFWEFLKNTDAWTPPTQISQNGVGMGSWHLDMYFLKVPQLILKGGQGRELPE